MNEIKGGNEKLLSISALSREMGFNRTTIYRWIDQGCPTVINRKNLKRLKFDDVIDWLNEKKNKKGDMNIIDN